MMATEHLIPFGFVGPPLKLSLESAELMQIRQVSLGVAAHLVRINGSGQDSQLLGMYRRVVVVGVSKPAQSVEDLAAGHEVQRRQKRIQAAEHMDRNLICAGVVQQEAQSGKAHEPV